MSPQDLEDVRLAIEAGMNAQRDLDLFIGLVFVVLAYFMGRWDG
jgi:hypothetical protein